MGEGFVIYHGTSANRLEEIQTSGITARPPRRVVFLTSDRDRAVEYAKARAAEATSGGPRPACGLVVTVSTCRRRLRGDEFNPHAEPDQFVLEGSVCPQEVVDLEVLEFPDLADPHTLSYYRAYAQSLAQDDWDQGGSGLEG